MLDILLLRKDLDTAIARLETRKKPQAFLDVATFQSLESERKTLQSRTEELQSQRNQLSKQVGMLISRGEKDAAEAAPTLHAARAAGRPVDVEVGGIAADSLGARRIGAIGWEVSQRHVHDALLLPDEAIRAAQRWLWKELKLAVEPAAALGLAALQTGAYRPQPQETVALILCGANFDPASLA